MAILLLPVFYYYYYFINNNDYLIILFGHDDIRPTGGKKLFAWYLNFP